MLRDQKYCHRNEECLWQAQLVDRTWLRKGSLSLWLCQWKLPKLKIEENKDGKKWNRISRNQGTTTKDVTYGYWEHQKKKEGNRRNIWRNNDGAVPPNLCQIQSHRSRKLGVHQAGSMPQTLHPGISYSNCRRSKERNRWIRYFSIQHPFIRNGQIQQAENQ